MPITKTTTPLADAIKSRLNELHRNQSWLAEQVGVSDNAVSKWMRTGKISRDSAIKVASALQMTVDAIFRAQDGDAEGAPSGLMLTYVSPFEMEMITAYREADETGQRLIEVAVRAAPRKARSRN